MRKTVFVNLSTLYVAPERQQTCGLQAECIKNKTVNSPLIILFVIIMDINWNYICKRRCTQHYAIKSLYHTRDNMKIT